MPLSNFYSGDSRVPVRPPILGAKDRRFNLEPNKDAGRIMEREFINNPYPVLEVEADLKQVANLKANMDRGAGLKHGFVLERMVAKGINSQSWFGPCATWSLAAEYDDIVNGIDGVLQLFKNVKKDYSVLAVAIDVTENGGGEKGKDIRAKLASIQAGLKSGELGKVKYFRPQRPNLQMKGEWRGVPKMVLVSTPSYTDRLVGQETGFNSHMMAMDFLIQLRIQAQVYAEYAKRQGNKKTAETFLYIDRELQKIFNSKFANSAFQSTGFAKNPNDFVLLKALGDLGFNMESVKI